jgi:large subunit ribosomal protein L17
MRHHKKGKKLGRGTNQRRALLKALAVGLILNGKIKTTETKAKELRPFIEKLVTHARTETLSAKRLIASKIGNGLAFKKLTGEIAKDQKSRAGGYTRITKLPTRVNDRSKMAAIEFVK